MKDKTIFVAGLGLIGGSLAKSLKAAGYDVAGYDVDAGVLKSAKEFGIDTDFERIGGCGAVAVCLAPERAVRFAESYAARFKRGALVFDICGVKRRVDQALGSACRSAGAVYIGAHPMAGIEKSGFSNSFAQLFRGASFIACPRDDVAPDSLEQLRTIARDAGFAKFVVATPEEHDRIIAYTSQLAHVVSSAYVRSETALCQQGFSAGSFKDMTRVATLDPEMWTELFIGNADYLNAELGGLIERLGQYRRALADKDAAVLKALLRDGCEKKKTIMQGDTEDVQ